MPSYLRGQKREELVYVAIGAALMYGWKRKDLNSIPGLTAEHIAALGHVLPAAVGAGKILVFLANAPKPPRVTHKLSNPVSQQGSGGTFCAPANLSNAFGKGWTRTKRGRGVRLTAPSPTVRKISAIAELSDGSLYVYPLDQADFNTFGAAFGLENSTSITSATEKGKLVSGSSLPKPGEAELTLDDGTSFSTFYGKNASFDIAGARVSIISEEEILTPVAAPAP